jgi:hypothetical protein
VNPLQLLGEAAQVLAKAGKHVPPEAVKELARVVRNVAKSDDPVRAATAAAMVTTSKFATDAAIRAALKKAKR